MNHAAKAASQHTAQPRLATPTDLGANATKDIAGALNALLADTFALYLKTKNFHWHMSGPHFRDYHLLLDEQADQIFAMTDVMAERVRKIGGRTLRSIGEISRQQRIADNDADYVDPDDMLAELRDDNQRFVAAMREAHDVCDEHNDVATASLLEVYIDETERRVWFLYEAGRRGDPNRALAQSKHRNRRVELGAAIGAAFERRIVAPPLRHLPVLVDMRGGPGGLGVERVVRERQRQQRRSGERGDRRHRAQPPGGSLAGMLARAAAIASPGCATCITPCASTKRAPSVWRAQASTGSQCRVWPSTRPSGASAR